MYPLGVTTPKCLITILNKPLVEWTLEALHQNGITEVFAIISAGVFGQKTRDHLESLTYPNMKITVVVQEQQLGTAHVVQMAEPHFKDRDEHFLFMYGDDLYGPKNVASVLAAPGLAIMGQEVTDPEKWGILQADEAGNLKKIVEKPKTPVGNLANIGCMKLSTRVFELFSSLKVSPRGEFELTDSLSLLAEETPIAVLPTQDYWIPIGYPWHILEAAEYFLPDIKDDRQGTIEPGVTITGKVRLPKSSIIKAGTYIDGNVHIGEHVIVGPTANLRGNVCIGDYSRIGFGVELKNSVIGKHVTMPHLAYIGDSIIGDYVNISAGCVAANVRHDGSDIETPIKGVMTTTGRRKFGAVIGEGVKLGVNTSIYPGRKIWPAKTTRPGQVVDKDIVD